MSMWVRAALAWLLLLVVMFANGAARVIVLQPRLGEDRARQAATLTGVALVLAVSWLLVRLSPGASPTQLWRVGGTWLACTLAFEFLFGRLVSSMSWSELLADYNLMRGRLWSLIPISVFLGPWLWGRASAPAKDGA